MKPPSFLRALVLLVSVATPGLATPAPEPFTLLVCGDSMIQTVASRSLPRALSDLPQVSVVSRISIGTGLARPDVFDWPRELETLLGETSPQAAVLLFGANDMQALQTTEGTRAPVGSEAWEAEYASRVDALLRQLVENGVRTILWVGLPDMRNRESQVHSRRVNEILEAACSRFGEAEFLDSVPLFSRTPGTFSPYVFNDDGMPLTVRAGDGVHFNVAGSDLLARFLRKALAPVIPGQ